MRFPASLAVLLALAGCASPPAEARSRPLSAPETLAGGWALTVEGQGACRLQLTSLQAGHGYGAAPVGECFLPIRQWRPVPDGVELAGADGLTVILLEPAGPNAYQGIDAARRTARLVRQREQSDPPQ